MALALACVVVVIELGSDHLDSASLYGYAYSFRGTAGRVRRRAGLYYWSVDWQFVAFIRLSLASPGLLRGF